MANEMEFVNYRDFVKSLTETENPTSADKTVISNPTNGPRSMPGSVSALTETAKEADLVAGNNIEIIVGGKRKKLPGDCIARRSVQNGLVSDVDDLKENAAHNIPVYEKLSYTLTDGSTANTYNYSGATYSGAGAQSITITSGFTPGDEIYVSGWAWGNYAWSLIGFFGNGTRLGGTTETNKGYTREKFTIPAGCDEIRVNGSTSYLKPPVIERLVKKLDLSDVVEGLAETDSEVQKKAKKVPVYEELSYTIASGNTVNVDTYSGATHSDVSARSITITSGFTPGDEIYVSGLAWGNFQWSLIGFFGSGVRLGGTTAINKQYTRENFTIPAGCDEIRVNGTNTALPKIEIISEILDLSDALDDINELKEDIEVLPTKANQVPKYTEIAGTISDGTIDAYDLPGTVDNTGSTYRHAVITSGFSAGEKIYITYHCGGNWKYRIGFFSSTARLLTYYNANETGYYKEFVVPEGCTEIRINGYTEVLPRAYKITGYTDLPSFADYDGNNDFNVANIFKRISDLQKLSPFTWKITKPTITFVFDDSLADIEEIYNLFKTKGVACGFATIPSRLNAYVLGGTGKTVGDTLSEAQADGFEVLNHGNTPITSTSSDSTIYNLFYTNKKTLVDSGFNVDGIILVGGTDSDTFDPLRIEPYLRRYYSYSDNYGKNLIAPQYYSHNRDWMTSTLATNKGFIDSAISNTSWRILSAHEVDVDSLGSGIGLDVLSDTIDYAIAQGCDILTMREVFNNSL